jgi:hypothetical protein
MTTRASGRLAPLVALAACVAACGSITLSPDGGGTTGTGGHTQTGAGGSTGAAGQTGGAGSTGAAGAVTGSAGSTGAAGAATGAGGATAGAAGSTGAAGATVGAAGTMGSAGSTGTGGTAGTGVGGTTGKGGSGGTGVMCGPVCDIFCQYGNVLDANGCPTCACTPAPAPCLQADCGPPPSYRPPPCAGAPATSPMCKRNTAGTCVWQAPFCPMCAPINCPNLSCMSGLVPDMNGCPTCTCNTCPQGTHAVACAPPQCNRACADGYVHDANGCATCMCRAAATCASPGVSCVACAYGYRAGPNGCRTCACEDPPAGCMPNGLAVP